MIEGADHFFEGRLRELRKAIEVVDERDVDSRKGPAELAYHAR